MQPGTILRVEKGVRSIHVSRGDRAEVLKVTEVERRRVVLTVQFPTGLKRSFYVQHVNRLNDRSFHANTGDPLQRLTFTRA